MGYHISGIRRMPRDFPFGGEKVRTTLICQDKKASLSGMRTAQSHVPQRTKIRNQSILVEPMISMEKVLT